MFLDPPLHLPDQPYHPERPDEAEAELHQGGADLPLLPCVVQVPGSQPAAAGLLAGQEDDWIQAELED